MNLPGQSDDLFKDHLHSFSKSLLFHKLEVSSEVLVLVFGNWALYQVMLQLMQMFLHLLCKDHSSLEWSLALQLRHWSDWLELSWDLVGSYWSLRSTNFTGLLLRHTTKVILVKEVFDDILLLLKWFLSEFIDIQLHLCSSLLSLLVGIVLKTLSRVFKIPAFIEQLSLRLNWVDVLRIVALVPWYREENWVSEAEWRVGDEALKTLIRENFFSHTFKRGVLTVTTSWMISALVWTASIRCMLVGRCSHKLINHHTCHAAVIIVVIEASSSSVTIWITHGVGTDHCLLIIVIKSLIELDSLQILRRLYHLEVIHWCLVMYHLCG